MKKFLKILLIIIGIVFLIFAALICIGLFVDYDDHIENGRYTYVPEDDNKDNAYVEFNLSDYDKKDSELIYYSSVEEAILNSPLSAENEEFSVPEDFLRAYLKTKYSCTISTKSKWKQDGPKQERTQQAYHSV